jgi:hypothetical protein
MAEAESTTNELKVVFGWQDSQVAALAARKHAVRQRAETGHEVCGVHPGMTFVAAQNGGSFA